MFAIWMFLGCGASPILQSKSQGLKRAVNNNGRARVVCTVFTYMEDWPELYPLDTLNTRMCDGWNGEKWVYVDAHWDPQYLEGMLRRRAAESPADRELFSEMYERRMEGFARDIPADVPTLLIRGKDSDMVSDEDAQHLKTLVPHCDTFNVRDARHMIAGDNQDIFSEALIGWMEARSGAGAKL